VGFVAYTIDFRYTMLVWQDMENPALWGRKEERNRQKRRQRMMPVNFGPKASPYSFEISRTMSRLPISIQCYLGKFEIGV
jgi:hypothetical protein